MKLLRRLVPLLLMAALGYGAYRFGTANAVPVDVDFIYATWQAPSWLALLAAAGVGAGLTGAVLLWEMARMGLVARRYRKAVRSLESENHQLRNLPLAGGDPEVEAGERESVAGTSA